MAPIAQAFLGTILTPLSDRSLSLLPSQLLAVDADGLIVHLEPSTSARSREIVEELGEDKVVRLGAKSWLMPGFVDTHSESPLSGRGAARVLHADGLLKSNAAG